MSRASSADLPDPEPDRLFLGGLERRQHEGLERTLEPPRAVVPTEFDPLGSARRPGCADSDEAGCSLKPVLSRAVDAARDERILLSVTEGERLNRDLAL